MKKNKKLIQELKKNKKWRTRMSKKRKRKEICQFFSSIAILATQNIGYGDKPNIINKKHKKSHKHR